jgi:uncharacterized protein (DUF4415 family)
MKMTKEQRDKELARILENAQAEKPGFEAEVKGYNKIKGGKSAIVETAQRTGAPISEAAKAVVEEMNSEKGTSKRGRPRKNNNTKPVTFKLDADVQRRFKRATIVFPDQIGSNSMSELVNLWIIEKLDAAGIE